MTDIPLLAKMDRDLRLAAEYLSEREVRYLVDTYYQIQENRKRADNQIRAMSESGEPHAIITWIAANNRMLENNIKGALDIYSRNQPLGKWARSQKGIGPVITAGLLAHINITETNAVSRIWRFAGLDPTVKWGRGQKRPWNADLKTLCWKIGESFVKVSGKEDAFYGQLYVQRKEYEIKNNEEGKYKDQAETGAKRVGKTTEAYKHYIKGKLPPGHIHSRAKRWAVKLFLAHYFETGRKLLGLPVPNPYPITHLGHVHKIEVPNAVENHGLRREQLREAGRAR